MSFGEALKRLLASCSIQYSHLAFALGYDVSYISKWISGSKLPSPKSSMELFRKIAAFIIAQADASGKRELALLCDYKGDAWDSVALQYEIIIYLQREYSLCRQSLAEKSQVRLTDNNAVIRFSDEPSKMTDAAEFIEALPSNRESDRGINIVTNTPDSAQILSKFQDNEKSICIRQLIQPEDFDINIDLYCRNIVTLLSSPKNIHYEFYEENSTQRLGVPFFVINHELLIHKLNQSSSENSFTVFTRDDNVISAFYDTIEKHYHLQNPMVWIYPQEEEVERNDVYNMLLQGECKCILPIMHPLHLGEPLMNDFLDKYSPVGPEEKEFQRRSMKAMEAGIISAVLFKSTIINYVTNGSIFLFGKQIAVDREDRIRHLRHLIDHLGSDSSVTIKIINDKNSLLNFSDSSLSIYLNNNFAFASDNRPNNAMRSVRIMSGRLINNLNEYYKHLMELSEEHSLSAAEAADYIDRCMKII